jgi:hypothetical protein
MDNAVDISSRAVVCSCVIDSTDGQCTQEEVRWVTYMTVFITKVAEKKSKWMDLKLHATVLFLDKAAGKIAVIWFTLFLPEHVQKSSLKWVATKSHNSSGRLVFQS